MRALHTRPERPFHEGIRQREKLSDALHPAWNSVCSAKREDKLLRANLPGAPTFGGEDPGGDFQLLQGLHSDVLQRDDKLLGLSIVKLDGHMRGYFVTRRRLQGVCRSKTTIVTTAQHKKKERKKTNAF